jgi:hypothetical protein
MSTFRLQTLVFETGGATAPKKLQLKPKPWFGQHDTPENMPYQ